MCAYLDEWRYYTAHNLFMYIYIIIYLNVHTEIP